MTSVLLVTGGSRGIGRAVALGAARRGHAVCLSYNRNTNAADDAVKAIEAIGGRASAVQADVGQADDVERLFAQADKLGPLAALVNNAGIIAPLQPVADMGAERLEHLFRVNVVGSFLCAAAAVRRLSTRHGGSGGAIVNLSSAAARIGGAVGTVDYAATKGAIETFTHGLAVEVAREGIRVNAVAPGMIATDIHADTGDPGRRERANASIPMGRSGTAEEVAHAILWLMSDEASYMTGSVLTVSGGR